MKNDIRIKILKGINDFGHTTEQKSANEFLSTIKTYVGTEDLGTIKEALDELIGLELIKETRKGTGMKNFGSTQGDKETFKNPRRFIDKVGDAPKVPELYLYCTLKGKTFLIENEKLKIDLSISKFQRIGFWVATFISIASLLLSCLTYKGTQKLKDQEEQAQLQKESQQSKNEIRCSD